MFEAVFQSIRDDLEATRQVFQREIHSDYSLFRPISEEIGARSGKWLRPGLFLLVERSCGRNRPFRHALAATLEMVHTASLLHDDVFDDAPLRRHQAATHVRYGMKAAILYGDFLVSRAFHVAGECDRSESYPALARILRVLTEGESLQDSLSRTPQEITEDQAREVTRMKTAEFLAETCALAGGDPARTFGLHVGMAYQILDDIMDVIGDELRIGKTLHTDLLLGRPTLPLAHLLARARADAAPLLPAPDAAACEALAALMRRTGALASAADAARAEVRSAARALNALRPAASANGDAYHALQTALRLMESKCDDLARRAVEA